MATKSSTALRDGLVQAFTENVPFKVLSLGFAVAIWAWVQSTLVIDQRARAHVRYELPPGLVSVDELPESLVLTLQGPRGVVRALERRDLLVSVDLSEAGEGPVSVDFSAWPVTGLPDGVRLVQLSPPATDALLDRRFTRQVKVKEVVIGDPAPGWKLVAVTVRPESVEISGPRSLVRGISEVPTDVIDIAGLQADKEVEAPLAIQSRTVLASHGGTIRVKIDVEPVIEQRVITDVPVLVRAKGWKTDPETATVTLGGPKAELDRIEADAVSVLVHLPEPRPAGAVTARFGAAEPPWIEVVHGGREDVEVRGMDPSKVTVTPEP